MSVSQIIFDASYLDEQSRRFADIRQDIYITEWILKRSSVLGGIECREAVDLSDSLGDIAKKLGSWRSLVENIRDTLRVAAEHTREEESKMDRSANAALDDLKRKYGAEVSIYDPNTVFKPGEGKTVPVTPVPALASVVTQMKLVGLAEDIDWILHPTTMTLSRTMMYANKEQETLSNAFEQEAAQVDTSIPDGVLERYREKFRKVLFSLATDSGD